MPMEIWKQQLGRRDPEVAWREQSVALALLPLRAGVGVRLLSRPSCWSRTDWRRFQKTRLGSSRPLWGALADRRRGAVPLARQPAPRAGEGDEKTQYQGTRVSAQSLIVDYLLPITHHNNNTGDHKLLYRAALLRAALRRRREDEIKAHLSALRHLLAKATTPTRRADLQAEIQRKGAEIIQPRGHQRTT
jgi:hypothetical protein